MAFRSFIAFIILITIYDVLPTSVTNEYVIHMEEKHAGGFLEAFKDHPVDILHLARGHIFKLIAKADNSSWLQQLASLEGVASVSEDTEKNVTLKNLPIDPLFMRFWGRSGQQQVNLAHRNVKGRGVTICILDDGVDHTIPEFEGRFRPELSFDYVMGIANPQPRFPQVHGTRVASVALGGKYNGYCGYGAAPLANLAAARIISPRGTVSASRQTLAFLGEVNGVARDRDTDIFVASWGVLDDGHTVDAPDFNTRFAIKTASKYGRHGRGSVILFAAGNGGVNDDCSCDGYASNLYAVTVQPAMFNGSVPYFTEHCAAAMTSAYVDEGLVASNPNWSPEQCTSTFSGTSAATPSVGGIIALALEAKPELTRRDVLHLLVHSSRTDSLANDADWVTNAAGHKFSPFFGFGLLNALDLVEKARSWNEYHPGHAVVCNISDSTLDSTLMVRTYDATPCLHINRVEHVVLRTTLVFHERRGMIELFLRSPSGTRVRMLRRRPLDTATNFINWEFVTPAFWNESPVGYWQIELRTVDNVPGLFSMGGQLEVHGIPWEYPTTSSTTTARYEEPEKDDRNWFRKQWDKFVGLFD